MPNKYDIGTRLNLRTQDRYRQTDSQLVLSNNQVLILSISITN